MTKPSRSQYHRLPVQIKKSPSLLCYQKNPHRWLSVFLIGKERTKLNVSFAKEWWVVKALPHHWYGMLKLCMLRIGITSLLIPKKHLDQLRLWLSQNTLTSWSQRDVKVWTEVWLKWLHVICFRQVLWKRKDFVVRFFQYKCCHYYVYGSIHTQV